MPVFEGGVEDLLQGDALCGLHCYIGAIGPKKVFALLILHCGYEECARDSMQGENTVADFDGEAHRLWALCCGYDDEHASTKNAEVAGLVDGVCESAHGDVGGAQ